jgi:hypothetical protein
MYVRFRLDYTDTTLLKCVVSNAYTAMSLTTTTYSGICSVADCSLSRSISTLRTMSDPQASRYQAAVRERLRIIVEAQSQGVFNVTPYPWQTEVIIHMTLMNVPRGGVSCAPLLLVRPTGGGKSLVRDVYSIVKAGVCLTITPLLSLGADQVEKISLKSNNLLGSIASIHLDEIRAKHEQEEIVKTILAKPETSHTTTFLFSSPQALVREGSVWIGLLDKLIATRRLSMICVDEVHLFVHFGLTFRKEFTQLKTCLFNKIKIPNMTVSSNEKVCKTTVPVLFMTATCNTFVVEKLQAFTNLDLAIPANVFWPSANEMAHRHVFFDVAYTIRPLQTFQTRVGPLLKKSSFEKYIYYSNTRAAINAQVVKIAKWIDKNGFKADILTVVGSLKREQKFYHVRVFNRSNRPNIQVLKTCGENERPFNPQILAATSGAANAGLDDPEVYGVTRIDFPPSILDIKQEKGRAGRRPGATPDWNWYVLCFSLESFIVLLKRMWDTPIRESVYLTQAQLEIEIAFLLFVLPERCLQVSLEMSLANPFSVPSIAPTACGNACAYCAGTYDTLFPPLVKTGVQSVLLQVFLGPDSATTAELDKQLVELVRKFKGSNRLMFGINSDKKPEPAAVKKMFLVLLAAKIMKYTTTRDTTNVNKAVVRVYGGLAFDSTDATKLALNVDRYWARIRLKEV